MAKEPQHKTLTSSQLSIWTGQQMHPKSPMYNMAHTFTLPISINVKVFTAAFNAVLNNADVLRTVFLEKNHIPYQITTQNWNYPIAVVDVSDKNTAEIEAWISNRTQRIFNLKECLFDTVLLKYNPTNYSWFLNIHHLITDASSSPILYKNTLSHYFNLLKKPAAEVKSLPLYEDYIAFESNFKTLDEAQPAIAFWKNKAIELQGIPKLYGATNISQKTASKRVKIKLNATKYEQLKAIAQNPLIRSFSPNLTMFTIFATLLHTFIYRVSGQKKIALGAPTANRLTPTFKNTPGLFIELFPVAVLLTDDDTFLSVLNRVKTESINYLRNGLPGLSNAKLGNSYNVILNYITANFEPLNNFTTNAQWIHSGHCDPNHHIRCHIYDFNASGKLELYFDINTHVFTAEQVANIPNHFLKLFNAFINDVNTPIAKPSILSPTEINALTINPIKVDTAISVIEQFHTQVNNNPTTIALRYKHETYTYAQVNEKAANYAVVLNEKGLDFNAVIGVHLIRSPEYIFSVLAILKLGATFIPLASDQPKDRIAHIVKNANCMAVISSEALAKDKIEVSKTILVETLNLADKATSFSTPATFNNTQAYIMYTSGSTGKPKGVSISNTALSNYINWAKKAYKHQEKYIFPLVTSISFDLTITATFLPLITGGEIVIYPEDTSGPDISIVQVIEDNLVNSIKLTPSHLALLTNNTVNQSNLKLMIVGGENFKTSLANTAQKTFGNHVKIINEYGPTEATVGCIVSTFNADLHKLNAIPIGKPIANMQAYVLDSYLNLVPKGVIGELYLSGKSLASEYISQPALTATYFVKNPFKQGDKMYKTGDLARWNTTGELEYLGRTDEQIKLNGFRIELAEIENNISSYPKIKKAAVVVNSKEPIKNIVNCAECGLPSSYPNVDFNEYNVCHLCTSFKGYKEKTAKYFKTETQLQELLTSHKKRDLKYDCLALLSGGKDSTYVLARLVNMGLKVLAFTLDNGYISNQAKENITKITQKLNVDHIYGQTPHMNKIFVDSLHRHKNVCNGCFKTIYTLSTQVALAHGIPFIVTGLSRGQFFETRLTEELFWDETADTTSIDATILEARKLYHQEEDAVKKHLDTSMFNDPNTFNKVQYVDFYRYSDVSLHEILNYLKQNVNWVRPTDTGRSTNCLINQAGIHVHKQERGYSNYSFPYSWDVRLGHKNRDEALEEINEHIDIEEVGKILNEIGYTKIDTKQQQLVGYFTATDIISSADLRRYLQKKLPEYMIPAGFKQLPQLPLTPNGKTDKNALLSNSINFDVATAFVPPSNEIEELVANIWKEVLQLNIIGIHDNFTALGGHSLAAIRVTARINDELQTSFTLGKVFELPTVYKYALYLEQQLTNMLGE